MFSRFSSDGFSWVFDMRNELKISAYIIVGFVLFLSLFTIHELEIKLNVTEQILSQCMSGKGMYAKNTGDIYICSPVYVFKH